MKCTFPSSLSLSLTLPYTVFPSLSFCLFNLLKTLTKKGSLKGVGHGRVVTAAGFSLCLCFSKIKISCAYPSLADLLTSARHAGAVSSRFSPFPFNFSAASFCLFRLRRVRHNDLRDLRPATPSFPPFPLLLRLLRVLTKY